MAEHAQQPLQLSIHFIGARGNADRHAFPAMAGRLKGTERAAHCLAFHQVRLGWHRLIQAADAQPDIAEIQPRHPHQRIHRGLGILGHAQQQLPAHCGERGMGVHFGELVPQLLAGGCNIGDRAGPGAERNDKHVSSIACKSGIVLQMAEVTRQVAAR